MQRMCVAVGMALMLGIVTPEAGVAQNSSTHPRLADSLIATDTPDAHRADSVSYEIDPFAAVVPWGPGERLEYRVGLPFFGGGDGHMEILGIDSVRGEPVYHAEFAVKAGAFLGLAKVNDVWESWIDTGLITSRRFVSDIHDPGYSSYRSFEFYPDEMYWHQTDEDVIGELGSALPQDDVSIFYFIRTLPLEVGDTYTLSRYFKKDGNPIVLDVERRDVREVGAVTFNAIVVLPTIQTDGLFAEGGEAELHFSDDENRYLVYARIKLGWWGSITLRLENIIPGTPIHLEAVAR